MIRIRYWFIRTYMLLFQKKKLLHLSAHQMRFIVGDIVSMVEGKDLRYLGKGLYIRI